MSRNFNENLRRAASLCRELKELAAKGGSECNDDSCVIIWGRLEAEMNECLTSIDQEIEGHKTKNKWD